MYSFTFTLFGNVATLLIGTVYEKIGANNILGIFNIVF